MVEGAKRFYALKGKQIPLPGSLKQLKAAHRERLDTVAMWLAENCEAEAGAFTSNETLYPNYEAWCKANGVAPKLQRALSDALRIRGFEIDRRKIIGKDLSRHCWTES